MGGNAAASSDEALLQSTYKEIVMTIRSAIDAEAPAHVQMITVPGGPQVGKQIMIDATERGGLLNQCRLSVLNPDLAPAGEVARIEFEHDKQGKFGVHRVYSVQSVRSERGGLVLLENFLAESPQTVREEDFRPISAAAYARDTVLKSVQDWTKYRAWQRQEAGRQH